MARSMWRGAIQFGLVTIPVKLYLATEQGGIGFNLLHKTDLSRIQMKVYCPADDAIISRSDTVRGYEWSKGKYVVVTEEDLESVPLKTVRSIEIEAFVDEDQAEEKGARFVKQAYYLEPDEIGRKAFYLLKSVLAETGKTAICKIVLKDREQLAALNPFSRTMLLTTLHWPDEIRSLEELNLPEDEMEIKPAERKMAEQLIASMETEFDPAAFRDEYREALMAVIEAKVAGEAPKPAKKAEPTKIGDLMAALEASVAAARDARREGAAAEAEKPAGTPKSPTRAKPATARKPAARKAKAATAEETAPARRRKTA
jgi:DNA end-binding protein Ku